MYQTNELKAVYQTNELKVVNVGTRKKSLSQVERSREQGGTEISIMCFCHFLCGIHSRMAIGHNL